MRSKVAIALSLILALAFGLRLWGISWGMPYAFHPDEDNYLPGAVKMLVRGDPNPHYFRNPPLLTYLVALEILPYAWVGQLLGFLQPAGDLAAHLFQSPTVLYVLARMNGAVLGTATVLLTYLAAARLLGPKVGILSALLLAVAFLHVRDSHYVVNDVPATFLLVASFYFAARIYIQGRGGVLHAPPSPSTECLAVQGVCNTPLRHEDESRSHVGRLADYLLSGILLGLAVATKYNVGLGAVTLVVAHLLSRGAEAVAAPFTGARTRCPGGSPEREDARAEARGYTRSPEGASSSQPDGFSLGLISPENLALWSRDLLNFRTHLALIAAGIASLLAFLVGNPYALLDMSGFLAGFRDQYGWASDPFRTTDASLALVILRSLSVGTSPIILAASALGLAMLALRRPGHALLLASFPLAYTAFFLLGSDLFYARFAIPLLPFVAILAGYGGVAAIEAAPPKLWRRIMAAFAIALLVLPPTIAGVKHNSLIAKEDTRLLLGRWVESNVPPGSKMAVEGYSFLDTQGRPMGPKRIGYQTEVLPAVWRQPLEYYRQGKFDYLIVSSYVYGRYLLDPDSHSEAIQWYQEAERQLQLVASISPTADGRELPFLMDEEITPIYTLLERDRSGPTLKVYRVGPAPRYDVEWLEATAPPRAPVGQKLSASLRLRNTGSLAWPSEGYTPVRVGYRWLDSSGREVKAQDLHSSLPQTVEPGGEVTMQAEIVAPATPGAYTLQLDLVQENFAWFSSKGARTRDVAITVQ